MAFYKVDTGHFGLVLWSVSGGEFQRSDLRTFKGGREGFVVRLLLAHRALSSAKWKGCHIKFWFTVSGNILMKEGEHHVLHRANSVGHWR